MKKTGKSIISLLFAVMMLAGTLALGFSASAEGDHDCAKDGHSFIGVSDADYSATPNEEGYFDTIDSEGNIIAYEELTHHFECKYCGEKQLNENGNVLHVYCRMEAGWKNSEDKTIHYIGCEGCDVKYKKAFHVDNDTSFKDSNGQMTSDGLCDVCKHELKHRYQLVKSTEATCDHFGQATYDCLYCDSTYIDNIAAPVGHNWTTVINETNPEYSYDKEGYSWAKVTFNCTRGCGTKLEYKVWANSGDPNNTVEIVDKKAATCEEDGYVKLKAVFNIDDISQEGWYPVTSGEGKFYKEVELNATLEKTGHNVDTDIFEQKDATCVEKGLKYNVCTVCNKHLNETEIPEAGHKFGTEKTGSTEATCTEPGTAIYECTVCGEKDTKVEQAALGHTYSEIITVATCTEDGSAKCSRCDETVVIPSKGHKDSNEDGICDDCGLSFAPVRGLRLSIANPSTKIIPYGHTIRLYAVTNKSIGIYSLKWNVEGTALKIVGGAADGSYLDVKATGKGTATISVELVDSANNTVKYENGANILDTIELETDATLFKMIISFFKLIFRIDMTIDF